jgi:hypothetical protein
MVANQTFLVAEKPALDSGAGVGIDFAVQGDFFQLRCGPFHFVVSFQHAYFSRMPPTKSCM